MLIGSHLTPPPASIVGRYRYLDGPCSVSGTSTTPVRYLDDPCSGYGKPVQSIHADITENEPIRFVEVPKQSASSEAWLNDIGRPIIAGIAGAADDEQKH